MLEECKTGGWEFESSHWQLALSLFKANLVTELRIKRVGY